MGVIFAQFTFVEVMQLVDTETISVYEARIVLGIDKPPEVPAKEEM